MPSQFSFGFPELLLSSRLVESGADATWCFELSLADGAGTPFLIAAGLESALELLEDLTLASTDLALLLAELGPERIDESLDGAALAKVGALRFHGDVEAVPEGTVLFAGQPLLRLRANAAEAAVVSQAVAGIIRAQSAVATVFARFRLAAAGKPVWESCGAVVARDEAMLMARSAQVGGASGTMQPIAAGALAVPALPLVPFTALVALGGRLRGLRGCAVELDGAARRDPRKARGGMGGAARGRATRRSRGARRRTTARSVSWERREIGRTATRMIADRFAGGEPWVHAGILIAAAGRGGTLGGSSCNRRLPPSTSAPS